MSLANLVLSAFSASQNVGQIKGAIWNYLVLSLQHAHLRCPGVQCVTEEEGRAWVGGAPHRQHNFAACLCSQALQTCAWSHRRDLLWINKQRLHLVMTQSLEFFRSESLSPQPHGTSRFSIQRSSGQEEVQGTVWSCVWVASPALSFSGVRAACPPTAPEWLLHAAFHW